MAWKRRNYSSGSKGSKSGRYTKSYDNSTRQTCAQRYSPTKTSDDTWYDAGGERVRSVNSYFDAVDRNGRHWEKCKK